MTTARKIEIDFVVCLLVGVALSGWFVWRNSNPQPMQLTAPILADTSASDSGTEKVVITPPPVTKPFVPKVDTVFQPSPDGTRKLKMTVTHNKNGTLDYQFTASDFLGENAQMIYAVSLPGTEKMSIPFNTWSPDDKYFFIVNGQGNAMVFTAAGEDIREGEQFIDVGQVFNGAGRKDTYGKTLGWASNTLLIANGIASDGSKGSSYWVEIPSKAVLQLGQDY